MYELKLITALFEVTAMNTAYDMFRFSAPV